MHTMVVKMSIDPSRMAEVVRHFDEDVVPWAKNQQGFVSGQWLCDPDGWQAMGIVVFESAAAAEKSAGDPRSHPRDEARAYNIESVSVFEQVNRVEAGSAALLDQR